MANNIEETQPPQIGNEQVKLLERLSNACSVSGDEGEVRRIVLDEVRPFSDEVRVDVLGNVLVTKRGRWEHCLRVMLAAHMDEVGLMLTYDEGDGIYRFELVGNISAASLLGKALWVGPDHVPGIIGIKPIHLTEAQERKNTVSYESMRIDVGPAKNKVKLGDRAVFSTEFIRQGPSLRGKALDNRIGVATLIELVKHAPPQIELQAAFTVQEEIGPRGARVAAVAFKPDIAIVLDCTPARDLPAWDTDENVTYNTRLGEGPAIYVADRDTIYDPRLVHYLVDIAETQHIPFQFRQPGSGGTDAAAIHKQGIGIPSVSVSVPGRYLHGPASIVRLSDWQQTLNLVSAALFNLTPEVLTAER